MPINTSHESEVRDIFNRLKVIFSLPDLHLVFINRRVDENGQGTASSNSSYVLAYANLAKRKIGLDPYTRKFRKPKTIKSIINLLVHEFVHFQKPPYRQFYHGRWITRQHYPAFYKKIKQNIEKVKKDKHLKKYYHD